MTQNTIETPTHISTGLLSATKAPLACIVFHSYYFIHSLDRAEDSYKKVMQSFSGPFPSISYDSKLGRACDISTLIYLLSLIFFIYSLSAPAPCSQPSCHNQFLVMSRSGLRTGTLSKAPGNKNLCHSIISSFSMI